MALRKAVKLYSVATLRHASSMRAVTAIMIAWLSAEGGHNAVEE